MASLANQTISSTYDGLIKTSSDNAVGVSGVQLLQDGSGNDLALSVGRSGNGVTITGNLAVSGDVSIADKIVHTGDTNTAIRFPAADTVTVETGGSEAMRIDSSGRVGINDTVSGSIATNYNPKLLVGGTIVARSLTSNEALIEIGGDATSAFITSGKQDGSQTARVLRFEIGTSEKVRITGDGLTFNGDTAAANALDDYEEGTWVPQPQRLSGGDITATYSDRQGHYTKIGNMVTCSFYIGISSVSSQGSNLTRVAGLPFVPASNYVDVGVIGNNTSFDTIDVVSFLAHTQGVFYFRESGNTITNVNVDWVDSSSVSGTITYRV